METRLRQRAIKRCHLSPSTTAVELRSLAIGDHQQTNLRGGSGSLTKDLADMISKVGRLFNLYRDRVTSVVGNLVMNSPETDKVVSLLRLNSTGDLSNLANVLDDKVISFLNELFGKPSESSGNIDDWTSHHS